MEYFHEQNGSPLVIAQYRVSSVQMAQRQAN